MATQEHTSSKTPLYQSHIDAGARLVDFSGWEMPVNYGSQIDEHHSVRSAAGMFDVSHMTILDIHGAGSRTFLSSLLANDIDKANPDGKAVYSCMLNETGGIIDDLIAYKRGENNYRLIVNAGTRDKDIQWIRQHLPADVEMEERTDLALIAVQGPLAIDRVVPCLPSGVAEAVPGLKRFTSAEQGDWFVGRTGYTGEDGVEIALPASDAATLWSQLIAQDVRPCGLGARDTLRLEAGMNLYGSDMDESVSPLESGLAWTVAFEPASRVFMGRQALEQQRDEGVKHRMIGLVLNDRGVLRGGQQIYQGGVPVGIITSGTFSPTLQKSIAFARVDINTGEKCQVDIRGKHLDAIVVDLPFVKNGKTNI